MTTFEALAKRIEQDLGLKTSNFKRVYSSKVQHQGFSMSWTADIVDGDCYETRIGSSENASTLVEDVDPIICTFDTTGENRFLEVF